MRSVVSRGLSSPHFFPSHQWAQMAGRLSRGRCSKRAEKFAEWLREQATPGGLAGSGSVVGGDEGGADPEEEEEDDEDEDSRPAEVVELSTHDSGRCRLGRGPQFFLARSARGRSCRLARTGCRLPLAVHRPPPTCRLTQMSI